MGTSVLLLLYFIIITLVSGWDFAQSQFTKYWYFIIALSFGFGSQFALYTYLKSSLNRQNVSARVLAASGTTSTAAMISCCSHYLANILPILGIGGFITLVAQYQIQLFWVGIVFNLAGIIYMAKRIYLVKKA